MTWLISTVVVVLLLAALTALLKRARGRADLFPYTRKETLLTAAERSFLGVLEQAIGKHYRTFAQVRVADVVETRRGLSSSDRQKAFNRISAKHFDFLLCDKGDLSPICAIELDDNSHQRRKRRDRDAFLDGLCQAVALPLLRVEAKRAYSVPELRAAILGKIGQRLEPSFRQDPVTPLRIEPSLFPSRTDAGSSPGS